MKQAIGNCVSNPFNSLRRLEEVIDKGETVSERGFLSQCDVPDEIRERMREYPNDYEFYRSVDGIYYYTWSAIEFFYK